MIKFALALALLGLGIWMFYDASYAVGFASAKGSREWVELTQDAGFLLRFAGALLVIVGAALAFAGGMTGPMISGLGGLSMGFLCFTLLLRGIEFQVFQTEVYQTFVVAILSGVLMFVQRED